MDKRAKGKRLEKMAEDILARDGYLVEKANPKLMFIGPGKVISRAHDFFGAWDIICVPKKEGLLKFIQVSVWEEMSHKIKQVRDFPQGKYRQEIWLWHSRGRNGHFRILESPNYK